jgi:hypothetical protein
VIIGGKEGKIFFCLEESPEDTAEFFNLILELRLTEQEKKDLVAFMRQL